MSGAGGGRVVLVGFDDEPAAHRALDRGIAEVREHGGRLVVLIVAEMPLDPNAPRAYATPADFDTIRAPLGPPPAIQPVIAAARERLHGVGVPVELRWAAGPPADEIIEVAGVVGAGLIVVGSHHHGMLGRLMGADVAADVQRHAPCEVVAVP